MKTVAFVIDVLAVILVIALVAPIHKKKSFISAAL